MLAGIIGSGSLAASQDFRSWLDGLPGAIVSLDMSEASGNLVSDEGDSFAAVSTSPAYGEADSTGGTGAIKFSNDPMAHADITTVTGQKITFICIFKSDSVENTSTIFDFSSSSASRYFQFRLEDSGGNQVLNAIWLIFPGFTSQRFFLMDGNSGRPASGFGDWHFVAVTIDWSVNPNVTKFYVDGTLYDPSSSSGSTSATPPLTPTNGGTVGGRSGASAETLDQTTIDEIKVLDNVVLDEAALDVGYALWLAEVA